MATDDLSIEELAGLVLMVGIGPEWSPTRPEALGAFTPGAVILYGRNVRDRAQVLGLTAALRRWPGPLPPLLAIDHEGGRVNRLRGIAGVTAFDSNRALAAGPTPQAAAIAEGRVMAAELLALGFALNLAPVVDVLTNPLNTDIAERSYGDDPELVADLGARFVAAAQGAGLICCAKHFPGYGSIAINPHEAPAQGEADRQTWERVHRPPFAVAVRAGVAAVMTGHVVYDWLDNGLVPGSLSPTVTRLLRDELGFAGAILTDDLEMGAIARRYDVGEAAVAALAAGADLVLVCHTEANQRAAHQAIVASIRSGRLTEERLREAAGRVIALRRGDPAC